MSTTEYTAVALQPEPISAAPVQQPVVQQSNPDYSGQSRRFPILLILWMIITAYLFTSIPLILPALWIPVGVSTFMLVAIIVHHMCGTAGGPPQNVPKPVESAV
jgi:hypothetical protein